MNEKYKVNINPKLPSDKDIAESMDFEKILKKSNTVYKPLDFRKRMHKKRTWIMLIISILAVFLACIYGV